jgi:hypothetical protein
MCATCAPEPILDYIAGLFFATRIFGPERAALLAEQLPATDAQAGADRAVPAILDPAQHASTTPTPASQNPWGIWPTPLEPLGCHSH